jgi:hypothetical protein
MAEDLGRWLAEAVREESQRFFDGATAECLAHFLRYSVCEKDWLNLPDEAQEKLVTAELNKLVRRKVLGKFQFLRKHYFYRPGFLPKKAKEMGMEDIG